MNNRYFICQKHKKYTDAGYRWAFWNLEQSNIVSLRSKVDVEGVLDTSDYWNPDKGESNSWLSEQILPTVKKFLIAHQLDDIEYCDEEFIYEQWELGYEWSEVLPNDNSELDEVGDDSHRTYS